MTFESKHYHGYVQFSSIGTKRTEVRPPTISTWDITLVTLGPSKNAAEFYRHDLEPVSKLPMLTSKRGRLPVTL